MTVPSSWHLPIAIALILLAGPVQAQQQQRRLTGDLPETPATADPAPTPGAAQLPPPTSPFVDAAQATSTPAPPPRHEIGDATRALLRMQAEGTHAGRALPILGDQAGRSYQRYINSFEHPIPEHFEQTVPNSRTP